MAALNHLAPLLTTLRDLLAWLKQANVRGTVIGGVAASLLGRPRLTRDVDAVVLVDEGRWQGFVAGGEAFGFFPRISDPIAFARQSHVLLLHRQASEIDVNISVGFLPFEQECIARSQYVKMGDLSLPIPTPEDLIIMKAVAHRSVDLADIESVLDVHSNLDLQRVRRWVREFSTALEMPEILDDLEAILARREKRR